ncbi:MAG: nitrous oxide reductase family maturation protein NosD [Bacillus sp. (in: firmicutes)]
MKKVVEKGAEIIVLLMLAFLVRSPVVHATDIQVNEGQSIQEAINQAQQGDTVTVQKGTYTEALMIDQSISLIGEEGAVIDGNGTGNVITITGNDITIEGLTVQNSGANATDSGIYVQEGQNHIIKDNVLKDTMHGIYMNDSRDAVISGNQISSVSEHFSNRGSGIFIFKGSGYTIDDNVMMSVQDGIYVESASDMTLRNNEAYSSRYGLHFMFAKDVLAEENHMERNITGMMIMDSESIQVLNNEVINQFHVRGFGLLIYESHDLLLEGNEIRQNSTGLSLEKTVDVEIKRNIISANQVGLEFIGENENNIFTENNFIANIVQSKISNNDMKLDNGEIGNYWDDYSSFDITGDGIGEETYKAGSLYDQLLEKQPYWQFFFESPSITLWSQAESFFPSLSANVYDEHPLVSPVQLADDSSAEEGTARDIGVLIVALSFLWFSILLIWLGRHFT